MAIATASGEGEVGVGSLDGLSTIGLKNTGAGDAPSFSAVCREENVVGTSGGEGEVASVGE